MATELQDLKNRVQRMEKIFADLMAPVKTKRKKKSDLEKHFTREFMKNKKSSS